MSDNKFLSLYIHIPFCKKKCLYCDFLSFPASKELMDDYFKALYDEVRSSSDKYKDYDIVSVFIGGGTPSFPDAAYIDRLMEILFSSFNINKNAEISMELNPGTASLEKLQTYRKAGINRLSIGTQSLDDAALKAIGRIHDSKTFYETYENARCAGFENINVDIMSALPGQSVSEYMDTVKKVAELHPEHISAYSLIIEEGTPFYDMDLDLPSEDDDRQMYHETRDFLEEHGYHRYEISNYAKNSTDEKYECFHNKVYWTRGNYLGLGLGASSMVENCRWKNIDDISKYIESPFGNCEDYQELSKDETMEEFMFLGLRLTKGVDVIAFKEQFNKDIEEVYGDVISRYQNLGLLEYDSTLKHTHLRLTTKGLDVANTVMADFLLG